MRVPWQLSPGRRKRRERILETRARHTLMRVGGGAGWTDEELLRVPGVGPAVLQVVRRMIDEEQA